MFDIARVGRSPWSIFDDLESLQEDFNRALYGAGTRRSGRRYTMRYPLMNVWSSKEGFVVDVQLPGVEPGDVDISVKGDELTISGKVGVGEPPEGETYLRRERWGGEFARTLQLPCKADADNVKAAYRNGILRVEIPRSPEEKPRKIQITG